METGKRRPCRATLTGGLWGQIKEMAIPLKYQKVKLRRKVAAKLRR